MTAGGEAAPNVMAADVVAAVRDGIMQGRYAPGQRLPESDLVALYRASRGAVRAALAQLEHEGVIEREHHRGARVRPISLDEAVEITEARATLEGLCAAKAAERATDGDRTLLRGLGAEMSTAVEHADVVSYSRVNQLVHRAVRDIARHDTAGRLLDRLRTQSVRYQYRVAMLPGRPSVGLREHLDVIEAICAGGPDGAEQAMRVHLFNVVTVLRQLDASLQSRPW